MAATDEVAIVQLGVEDAASGLVLSTEARWNQNEADWRFFLSRGIVFGVRDHAGGNVAVGAGLLLHHDRLARELFKLCGKVATEDVGAAAGGKADEDVQRPARIVLLRRRRAWPQHEAEQ